jgi:hypothetical protein
MPAVPMMVTPQVSAGGLPGPQGDGRLKARLEAGSGGDMLQLGAAMQQMGGALDRVANEQQATLNESAVKDALARLTDAHSAIMHDPEKGYANLRGKAALDAYEGTLSALQDAAKNAGAGLTNPEQKRLYNDAAHITFNSHVGELRQRASAANNAYALDASKARGDAAADAAVRAYNPVPGSDNAAYKTALATQKVELLDQARRLGYDKDQTAAFVQDAQARTLTGVISHLMDNNQARAAQGYFKDVRDQLPVEVADKIQRVISAGVDKDSALDLNIQMKKVVGPDITKQEEYLNDEFKKGNITAEVHGMALQLARADNAQRRSEQGEQDRRVLGAAWETKLRSPGATVASLPAAMIAYARDRGLGPQLTSIMEHEGPRARTGGSRGDGEGKVDDTQAYASLMRMSAEDPEAFAKLDLAKLAGTTLGKSRWDKLLTRQTAILARDDKVIDSAKIADSALRSIRTDLQAAGLPATAKPGSKEAQERATFEATFHDAVEAAAKNPARKGQPLTTEEARTIGLGLLKQQTLAGSGYFGTSFGQEKGPAYKLVEKVPAEDRALITQALQARGLPVTPAAILDLYNRKKAAK